MKLSKKLEAEVTKIYDTWLNSYLNGDVKTYGFYLDDDYHFIGSTNNEEFLNRKNATKFFEKTADQLAGKTDIKNRVRTIEHLDGLVFITEVFDAWFLTETKWTYYGRFRFTSVLSNKKAGWHFIYQHFSMPDSKAEDGETLGTEQVTKENQELKDAIKRRTLELEQKNHELEIEASMERVRARSLTMQSSDELVEASDVMFMELEKLAINTLRIGICTINGKTGAAEIWSRSENKNQKETKILGVVPKGTHPVFDNMVKAWKAKQPFFTNTRKGKAVETYYKTLAPHLSYPLPEHFNKEETITTFFFKEGSINVVSLKPLEERECQIMLRFAKVFGQIYQRFLDLQKAEAQAKEAEIELALERVRARTMAMQHSDELAEASFLLDQQVRALGIKTWGCAFNIYREKESTEWFGNEAGVLHTYTVPRAGIFKEYYQKGQNGESLLIKEFSGDACVAHYEYMSSLPVIGDVLKKLKETNDGFPTYQIDHVVYFKYGYLLFITRESVPDAHDIFIRFAKVFEQTYTRFLDLQKAEAQAKESEIELALERVRARTMAMQQSHELKDVIQEVYNQFIHLKINIEHTGFILDYKATDDMHIWLADSHEVPSEVTIPYFDCIPNKSYVEAKRKGANFYTNLLDFKEKNKFYKALFKFIPDLPQETIDYYFSCPGLAISTVLLENVGLYIENFSGIPFSEDDNKTLMRFGKVFQQTYTRFLDLQKSEAQAREAQIELGLERVRARAMAMQKSDELSELVSTVRIELTKLDFSLQMCIINIINEKDNSNMVWATNPNEGIPDSYYMKFEDYPFHHAMMKAYKEQKTKYVYTIEGEEKLIYDDYLFGKTEFKKFPKKDQKAFRELNKYICSFTFSNFGGLQTVASEALTDESLDILARFGKVFDLTYTRFRDLEKAEAQTREAQIEMALEKVRSRTMAMQHSKELPEAANVLFTEVQNLGIPAWSCGYNILSEDKKSSTCIMSSEGEIQSPFVLPLTKHKSLKPWHKAILNNEDFFAYEQGGNALVEHYAYMESLPELKETFQQFKDADIPLPTFQVNHLARFTNGFLLFITYERVPEAHDIFQRFAKVFEQTYSRFLDLQKAEAQAREAQIEAALERVRSRSMAMHKSEDLLEVINVVSEQLQQLDIKFHNVSFGINDANKDYRFWLASPQQLYPFRLEIPYLDNAMPNRVHEAQKNRVSFFTDILTKEESDAWHYHMLEHSGSVDFHENTKKFIFNSPGYARSTVLMQSIFLTIGNYALIPYSEEENDIFRRFAKVFEQSYTRFLDLQKAEAQAREAQIEAALERVRSRSMAMHNSEELLDVISVVSEQLQQLDFKFVHVSFANNDIGEDYKFWTSSKGMSKPMRFNVPYLDIAMFNNLKEAQEKSGSFYTDILTKEEHNQWHNHLLKHGGSNVFSKEENEFILSRGMARSISINPNIILILANFASIPYSNDENKIIERFGQVFDQSYTRFLDLQKAEKQAKEAQIEASLERVRSRTMAMQNSDELAETSVVVFKQLMHLGIEPNRLYIGIIKDANGTAEFWITDEDGTKISTGFSGNLNENVSFAKILIGWKKKKKSITIDIQGNELRDYFKYLTEINVPFKGGLSQKRRIQNISYFSQGFIGMASPDEQPEETTMLLERFAAVFNLTYTRFNDLKIAEAHALQAEEDLIKLQTEKKRAEEALTELKATQSQLIQSEKMASLGELTAGIAHEIQNPLNFVNNFSEVSKELLDEMKEELNNGNIEDAIGIMLDVIQNLEKINHHGKRADGIVKGMLQHSRSSSGTKEPTDINALCDEYLRLAYHGLRAKDKSFNADFKTDLDESLKKINVIPQDMGRVILNLITNAFYAVNEKKLSNNDHYKPSVSVSTLKKKNAIEIRVKDNGNGIPQKVLDKIFQPFFTTKPTGQGTGLGLSLSYDIIKTHGGELKVETKEGEGTEFIVVLPIEK
tara:strand:- start:80 stop:5902 length:5823 start_codon:yes stop_codon:yes gene_type:complete